MTGSIHAQHVSVPIDGTADVSRPILGNATQKSPAYHSESEETSSDHGISVFGQTHPKGLLIGFICFICFAISGTIAIVCFFSVFSPFHANEHDSSAINLNERDQITKLVKNDADTLHSELEERVFHKSLFTKFHETNGLFPVHRRDETDRDIVIDIGANEGKHWTASAINQGLLVYAFEPSSHLKMRFLDNMMALNFTNVAVIEIPSLVSSSEQSGTVTTLEETRIRIPKLHPSSRDDGEGIRILDPKTAAETIPDRNRSDAFVYFIQAAVGDQDGLASFIDEDCPSDPEAACGKKNQIIPAEQKAQVKMAIQVPIAKLSSVDGIDHTRVWAVRIGVEGQELDVVEGAKSLLLHDEIPHINIKFGTILPSLSFSQNVKRNVKLLRTLHEAGYTCYHMDDSANCGANDTDDCLWKWSRDMSKAPKFEEYADYMVREHRATSSLNCELRRYEDPSLS